MGSRSCVRIRERDRNQFLHGGREIFGGVVGEHLLGRAHMVVPPQRNRRGGLVSFGRVRGPGLRAGAEASHSWVIAPGGWRPAVSVRGVVDADGPPNARRERFRRRIRFGVFDFERRPRLLWVSADRAAESPPKSPPRHPPGVRRVPMRPPGRWASGIALVGSRCRAGGDGWLRERWCVAARSLRTRRAHPLHSVRPQRGSESPRRTSRRAQKSSA
jgi:hypothetical protein